ncbi:leucine-rich repeat receptor-like serine/threonine/tyrosine-protein kinase SOBIR1 [Phoenix dactylifera]|uniref:Leucine-rich repeat receptor-like serine/threonine/tyrosine-protein kinase SOBIR1 n=1 Tax=Phoenix dactylifera TaxID=42345 RepID=A0A8B7CPB2_PHODC|nr:leucine-rich repeat receptor-like serine/threonine/tyrosine-protein kinase SOBIR1 [Phoenix dactylifera]
MDYQFLSILLSQLFFSLINSSTCTRTFKDSVTYSSDETTNQHPAPTTRPSMPELLPYPLWVSVVMSFSIGFALGPFLFILWRLAISRCRRIKTNKEELASSSSSGDSPSAAAADTPTVFSPMLRSNISFIDKLRHNNFPSGLQVIGRGGCGEVYKAELLVSGRRIPIAIKKVLQPSLDAANLSEEERRLLRFQMRQIRSEILTVGRMRHPNLLRLLAHVPQPECHYLVYEFMHYGSLHDVLKRGARELDWPTRYRIALGIAAGLEYLHMVHRPRIIHRDLKPANILLDDGLNARIADFGLAKVVPDFISGPFSSGNIAGTVGYIAPEYFQTLSCTDKCDIYSFGVILAVLVTGKFPNDVFFQMTDEMFIIGWVRSVLRSDDPKVAIDPNLVGCGLEEQMLLVLKIACFCTYDDPSERPNSKDVRCMLSQIKH